MGLGIHGFRSQVLRNVCAWALLFALGHGCSGPALCDLLVSFLGETQLCVASARVPF